MADLETSPLTDEERAELEALRAEKARRERAELEALRAESAAAAVPDARRDAASDLQPAAHQSATPSHHEPSAQPRVSRQAPKTTSALDDGPVVAKDPAQRTFGQRMVLSDAEDEDGVPAMPPAQKIIIAVALIAAICFAIYMATR